MEHIELATKAVYIEINHHDQGQDCAGSADDNSKQNSSLLTELSPATVLSDSLIPNKHWIK